MKLTESRGRVIAIGGHENKEDDPKILRKFVELAGDGNSHVVVMTVATDMPEEVGKEYANLFKQLGAKKISVVDVSEREDASSKKNIEAIKKATALFFTGGDQLHITSLMGGTELQEVMFEQFEEGMLIAGTSAGAAMMSNSMIIDGPSEESPSLRGVEIGPGMDLVIGAMIDTHFSQRGRHGRLLSAVAHYPQDLGLGIDENTAIIVNKGEFEVIGEGTVTVIDGGAMAFTNAPDIKRGDKLALADIKLHVLPEGYKFNLQERCVIIPKKTKAKRAGKENGSIKGQ